MLLTLPFLLQATAPPLPSDFDLARLPPKDECEGESSSAEIVVCARRDEIPLAVASSGFEPPPKVAGPGMGFKLSDSAQVNVFAEGVALPGGFISNRAMVTLKIAF